MRSHSRLYVLAMVTLVLIGSTDRVRAYEVFDHFTTALDIRTPTYLQGLWVVNPGGSTPTSSGTQVTLDSRYGTQYSEISSAPTFCGYGTYLFKIGNSAPSGGALFGIAIGGNNDYILLRHDSSTVWNWQLEVHSNGVFWNSANLAAPVAGDEFAIVWTASSVKLYKNSALLLSENTLIPTATASTVFDLISENGLLKIDFVAWASASIYDHFDLNTLSNWTVTGSATVANSEVTLDSTGGYRELASTSNFNAYGIYSFKIGSAAPTGNGSMFFGIVNNAGGQIGVQTGYGGWRLVVLQSGQSWIGSDTGTPAIGDVYTIIWTPTSVQWKKNGKWMESENTVIPVASQQVKLDMLSQSSSVLKIDYASIDSDTSTISRGRQIILDRGIQIQSIVYPYAPYFLRSPTTQWASANFTTFNFWCWVSDDDLLLPNLPAGQQWARNFSPPDYSTKYLNQYESTYLTNFVSFQYGDELGGTIDLEDITATFQAWRTLYPNTLVHTNFGSHPGTFAEIQSFMQGAKPDMILFDYYPSFANFDGARDWWYYRMQQARLAGLAGNSGAGERPIPYGQFLNTFRWGEPPYTDPALGYDDPLPSESFIRLQQFASWAMGYTFLNAHTYNQTYFPAMLFHDAYDTNPTLVFGYVAQANVESKNLGPALKRLVSTDIRMLKGSAYSTTPLPAWPTSGVGTPCPKLTGIARQSGVNNRDILIGYFAPLKVDNSDYTWVNQTATTWHFMVVNGASGTSFAYNSTTGDPASNSMATIRLTFTVPSTATPHLEKKSRFDTTIITVPLTKVSSTSYRVDIALPGGTGELLKFYY